ncbi:hypothetical protein J0A67_09935 [Algoriphagus aestuariicola]|uniref:Uncharacterized protein n=1 Tax=Algoriphagus aestuariicola TaxID=1852016 RepID=A0ABS3BPF6_9BACT|nr:hypothetical protein [Algoriphagus aestuariicola]MBN7801182.1 hypothetical protein [Algoriphagus aestuariicola]
MKCGTCESDNVQKLSVIYQNGTSKTIGNIHSSHSGGGIGFGSGGIGGFGGVGTSRSTVNTTTSSDLAKRCAPPDKYNFKAPTLMVVFALAAILLFDGLAQMDMAGIASLAILGLIGGAVYFGYKGFSYNKNEYPVLMQA